jgi:hypothetical protein
MRSLKDRKERRFRMPQELLNMKGKSDLWYIEDKLLVPHLAGIARLDKRRTWIVIHPLTRKTPHERFLQHKLLDQRSMRDSNGPMCMRYMLTVPRQADTARLDKRRTWIVIHPLTRKTPHERFLQSKECGRTRRGICTP